MVVSPIQGHRVWARSYDRGPNPLLALEQRVLPPIHGSRVVDVGCGTGRWTARLGAIGVDLCEEMLCVGARKPDLRGRLLLAGAASLPLRSACSDVTLCSFVIGYIEDLAAAMAEMARITRPGGQVVISELHPAALAAGWTRSFRAVDGVVYKMDHRADAIETALWSARRCGLRLTYERAACFGEPERSIFEAAGKPFDTVALTPAVWVGAWTRP